MTPSTNKNQRIGGARHGFFLLALFSITVFFGAVLNAIWFAGRPHVILSSLPADIRFISRAERVSVMKLSLDYDSVVCTKSLYHFLILHGVCRQNHEIGTSVWQEVLIGEHFSQTNASERVCSGRYAPFLPQNLCWGFTDVGENNCYENFALKGLPRFDIQMNG